jgi:hypothetical protein
MPRSSPQLRPKSPALLLHLFLFVQETATFNAPERITALGHQQIDGFSVLSYEAPLGRLEHGLGPRAEAHEAHDALVLAALDAEADVDVATQLVHGARDPRDLLGKVDLVAEVLAGLAAGAQGVERGGDRRRRQLLVVEDGEARQRDQEEEDGESTGPAERDGFYA